MVPSRGATRTALMALSLAIGLSFSPITPASPVSYQGNFANDNDLVALSFSITSSAGGSISARTFSYNGGVNAAGATVASGGFAPVLTLFGSDGYEVFSASTNVPCSGLSFCWDADLEFSTTLAGSYTLVLSQDGNFSNGSLMDGYAHDADPNYTALNLGSLGDPNATFIQIDGTQRTAHWAFDLNVVNTPVGGTVPEPASTALVGAALGVLAVLRRRPAR